MASLVWKGSDLSIHAISLFLALTWATLVASLAFWDYRQLYNVAVEIAVSTARENYEKDVIFRRWATMHGGVYVEVTPETPPNPYLAHVKERDLTTPSGRKLTLMNPAYITRQAHELGKRGFGHLGHITSLKPIRPENAPDDWEKSALASFEKGQKEIASLQQIGNQTYMRLMRPLVTEAGCLKCHASQGYKVGDIRGGISVSIQWAPFETTVKRQRQQHLIIFGVIFLAGLAGIGFGYNRVRQYLYARKKAEEVVRKSEERFRAQYQGSPIPKVTWQKQGEDFVLVDFNAEARIVTNGKILELVGSSAKKLYAEHNEALDDLNKCYENRQVISKEIYSHHFLPGRRIIITYAFVPPDLILVHMEDVTERRQVEQALQDSEIRFKSIVDESPLGIHIYAMTGDDKLIFIGGNPSADRILGIDHRGLIGQTIEDAFPGLVGTDVPSTYRKIALEGTQWRTEQISYEHGLIRGAFEVVAFQAEPKKMVAMFSDITERKRTERELLASEGKFRDLLDNIQLVGVMLDREGHVTFSNDYLLALTGWSRAEVINRNWFDLFIPHEERENVRSIFLVCMGGGNIVSHYENPIMTRTGGVRQIVWDNTVLRDGSGAVIGTASIGVDVTDQRRIEESLRRAEKMEALGTLAGGVAHDLNNTLGVTMSYAELLQEDTEEGSHARKYADRIFSSTEKAAATVQDLLTLARRGVSVSEVMNLTGRVSILMKSPEFERLSKEHPLISFRTDLERNLLNIKGSPVHIEKTILNLLSNAAESISGMGEVTIRTESRYVEKPIRGYDEVKAGEYAVLTVSDSGRGIRPEDLGRIFEPFYTKKKMGRSGTGLGLSIVWGTVKDHEGYIDVESREGEGTTFTLYFPVTREEMAGETQRLSKEQYMGKGETVFVVDDDAGQRQIAETILRRLNYKVVTLASGEEAVGYLRSNGADMVILDMIMDPGMDGLDTYREILKINPRQRAIIVSGFSETERVKEALRLGAGAYVKKPYATEKIGITLRRELERP